MAPISDERILVLVIGSAGDAAANFAAMCEEIGRGVPSMWGSNRDFRGVTTGDWLVLVQSNLGRAAPTVPGKWFGPYVLTEVGSVSGRGPVSWSTADGGRHDGDEWDHVWRFPAPTFVDTGRLRLDEFTARLRADLQANAELPHHLRTGIAGLDADEFAARVVSQIGNKPGQLLPEPSGGRRRPPAPPGGRTEGNPMSSPEHITSLLTRFRNVVVEGVPGTGKSFLIDAVARSLIGDGGYGDPAANTTTLVLHPSTTYEVFVEGLRATVDTTVADASSTAAGPTSGEGDGDVVEPPPPAGTPSAPVRFDEFYASTGDGAVTFRPLPGAFVHACMTAVAAPDERFLVVLDELNRANVPQVLGDLLLCLESSKRVGFDGGVPETDRTGRSVRLQYSGAEFFVPDNVFVLATMNTADRSVAPLDAALRRRFAFVRLEPLEAGILAGLLDPALDPSSAGIPQWRQLNAALQAEVGPDAMLGHSYFFDMAGPDGTPDPAGIWRYQILPQLIDALAASDALTAVDPSAPAGTAYPQLAAAISAVNRFTRPLGFELRVHGRGLDQAAMVADVVDGNVTA